MATRGSFCPVAENKNAQRKLFVILSEPNDGLVTLSLFMYIIKQSIITSSVASILNQTVKKRTGFGLVLNQTKHRLVFSH